MIILSIQKNKEAEIENPKKVQFFCLFEMKFIFNTYFQSIGAPRSGARSERRSGKLARSAVGAPLRKKAGALVVALALRLRSSKQ